jgi:NAD(P)-dependent dehydrogenase (short-subunit alcohol dehydrogenase family)
LVAEGAHVVFSDIDEEAGRVLEADLGRHARFVAADATRDEDVARLTAATVAALGSIDVAINNVGGVVPGGRPGVAVHDADLDGWAGTLALCLDSCFFGMRHQLRVMLDQGAGVICNTASLAGLLVAPDSPPAYSAAKAGVIHLTEQAAAIYADRGIRVNAVAPGLTATPAVLDHFDVAAQQRMSSAQPMKRMLAPQEVAEGVLWLCADAASGVTGMVLRVDGGGWVGRGRD